MLFRSKAEVFFGVRNARAFASGAERDFSAVGIRADDDLTLVVTLTAPNPRFPHVVASGPWLPVRTDLVARHGRRWTEPDHFIGNGPFTLGEWKPDQHVSVRRNPRWHGAGRVSLDGIRFIRFDSGDAEDRAYRAGRKGWAGDLVPRAVAPDERVRAASDRTTGEHRPGEARRAGDRRAEVDPREGHGEIGRAHV